MSSITKRILFAAATTGLLLAGVGPVGHLSLGTAAFAKEDGAGHDRGDKGDKGHAASTASAGKDSPSPDKGTDPAGNDSPDAAGDR